MIAAGIGFRRGCPAAQMEAALSVALQAASARASALTLVCVPDFKAADSSLALFMAQLDLPLRLFSLATLRACPLPTMTQSSAILQRYGVGSLSEACALLAALEHGAGARLLGPRSSAGSATCALAISEGSP